MTGTYPFRNYRVLFTPLVAENVYGSTIDVTLDIDLTDFVKSFGTIKREIDNGDYDIGLFTFGDITLSAINHNRKFNDPSDPKSIFKFRRDRCKVEIIFYDEDANNYTRFKGLINDDATRLDFTTGIMRFKVLSLDSIFRQTPVPSGAIVEGDLFSTAIKKILNVPQVTSTLTYLAANVNVDYDIAIDNGEVFSSLPAKDALDALLLASNSIMYVDNADVIHVKARIENVSYYELFGHGNILGRENILAIKNYNNGIQRSFSSVSINDNTVVTSDAWVAEYGFRQKSVSIDCITLAAKEELIGQNILDSFSAPKAELELLCITKYVSDIELLDLVSVDYDYRIIPYAGDDIAPTWGTVTWGAFNWPVTTGSLRISPKIKWKVIGIEEDPVKFTTFLKLRQAGTARHDGYFDHDAQKLITYMTTAPSAARRILINDLVKDLKEAQVWHKIDVLYVMAAHNEQAGKLNWKDGEFFGLTNVSATVFTADGGFTGDGVADYLDTGWAPSTNGVSFVQNSAHVGVFCLTTSVSTGMDIGLPASAQIGLRFSTGTELYQLNSAGSFTTATTDTAPVHIMAVRAASTAHIGYINGEGSGSDVDASAAVAAGNLVIGQGNAAFSDRKWAIAHAGGALTTLEARYMYQAFEAYLTGIAAI